MGKILLSEYNITNPNLDNNHKVAFLSDIHNDYNKLEQIIEILKNLKISIVLLTGDLKDDMDNDYSDNKIKELLEELSKTSSIFFSFGNHDLPHFNDEPIEVREEIESKNNEYWNSLRSIDNIHIPEVPKDKATVSHISLTHDIDLSTLNIPVDYYWNSEPYEEYSDYVKSLNSIKNNTKKFNILLSHSPRNIIKDNLIDDYLVFIKKYNLILSGHMHGGLIPYNLRNESRKGLIGPYASFLPNDAYGIVEDNNTISLTTGGVTKIADSSELKTFKKLKLFNRFIDRVYPSELEILNIIPGENNKITKTKQLLM